MKITELVAKYLIQQNKTKKPTTKLAYQQRFEKFLSYLIANQINEVNQLNETTIKNYTRIVSSMKSNTAYVYLQTTQNFLRYLYQNSYIFHDLSIHINLPKWQRPPKANYTTNQTIKILHTIQHPYHNQARNKAIVALHLLAKLKTSQVAALTILDLNLEAQELRLASKRKFLQLPTLVHKTLQSYLKMRPLSKPKSDYLFITNPGGRKMSIHSIRAIIKKALKGDLS